MKICRKISNIIMIIAFLLVLTVPTIWFWEIKDTIPPDTSENRKLAEKPKFDINTLDNYSDDYEAYYNDNLPFRSFIRNTWTNFNFFVFGESTTNQVLVGKNDGDLSSSWLFYQENYDGNPIKETQGVYKFTEDEVLNIGKTINTNVKELKTRNIDLYYAFIPNKANLYREKLPDNITIFDPSTRVDKLYNVLKQTIEAKDNLMYLKEDLEKSKDIGQLYFKQDTHWNDLGAFIGFETITKKVSKDSGIDYTYEVKFSEEEFVDKDLSQMSGIKGTLKDTTPTITYLSDVEFKGMVLETENQIVITECEDAKVKKTIMVIGDSFRTPMIPYFAKNYQKVIFLHRCDYGSYMLDAYAPDIIVCQFLERYVNTVQDFKLY